MPFSIRPFRRFSMQYAVTHREGPFIKLPLVYFCGFGSLITLLVLSSGPAYAEWVSLGESDSGTAVYVNRDTSLPKGKLMKMWVLYSFRRVRTVAGGSYFSNKVQREYNCAQAYHRTLVDMRFSSTMGLGKVVYSKSSQGKWVPVAPESFDQILWKLACRKHRSHSP